MVCVVFRLLGLLVGVSEELMDVPLYYTLKDLCGTLHCVSPRMDEFKVSEQERQAPT